MAVLSTHTGPRKAALDFGCGVGRLTIPFAAYFDRLVGVDISPTMLEKLGANCKAAGVENVTPCLTSDPWEDEGPFDLINSYLVFQHLPDDRQLADYLLRIGSSLTDRGVCVLQFDSRPITLPYRIRKALPDAVLAPRWRTGLRRIRRPPDLVHALLKGAGLQIVNEHGAGTELHMLHAHRA